MARKNLIGVSAEIDSPAPTNPSNTKSRPLVGFVPPVRSNGPVGGITKSLSNITSTMERAQGIERQLAEGQTIIELDTSIVDSSFVSDRLAINQIELSQLAEQIRENGQQVPILVRPNPNSIGRYQVAYGHRRLAAVRQLGITVRAVVRDLTDEQLVVSQGQENNARTNLSYIERALFAARLEDRSFTREVIMSALGVDKAALSKMLSVVRQIDVALIEAIGSAPDVGRRRWMDLAELLNNEKTSAIIALLQSQEALADASDARFQIAFTHAAQKLSPGDNSKRVEPGKVEWVPRDEEDASVTVSFKNGAKKAVLTLEATDGPKFARYITSQLERLYEGFRRSENRNTGD
ncbi:plasmid partitioning protein RepB [Rhizobium sp. CG4]|uniref:plasmid partitioning protein RepB n=1 Tax=Rhizobium sp. CG4 TaxID=2726075 RepID=UPI00203451CB|nr:plasmid partitioning protein RepB [Rhizobium sp. CG4]MCM2458865.1 plasmid partitioning protein RepB [Rhizobium sp. CG4]